MPSTSVKISQTSASRAAAKATAVVSEPPRPSVVISLVVPAHALEAGHDRDVALVQRRADPVRVDVDDPGLAVDAVGDHAGLGAGEGLGGGAELVDGHGQQGHGDAFAGGEQHVHFAGRGGVGHLGGEVQEFVGGVAHGGDDHDDLVAGVVGVHDAPGDALDAFGVRHGGTAELLHDEVLGGGRRIRAAPAAAVRAGLR